MQFTPLDDQILVRRELGDAKQGALHIPDRAVERPLIGEVIAVGPGRLVPGIDTSRLDPSHVFRAEGDALLGAMLHTLLAAGSDRRVPLQVRPGDRVLFRKYGGTDVKFDGAECMVLRESDVLGVIVEAGPIAVADDSGEAVLAHVAKRSTPEPVRAGSRVGKTLPQSER